MKPKIGRTIYIIYGFELYMYKVGYVGEASFIIDNFQEVIEECQEYKYDEYEQTWFTSFLKAKKELLKQCYENGKNERYKLFRKDIDLWVAEGEDL